MQITSLCAVIQKTQWFPDLTCLEESDLPEKKACLKPTFQVLACTLWTIFNEYGNKGNILLK